MTSRSEWRSWLAAHHGSSPGIWLVTWDGFPRSTRRAILEWILGARTAPTRTRRITQTAEQAARGVRANQWRQPKSPS